MSQRLGLGGAGGGSGFALLEQIWEDGCARVLEEHVGDNFMGTSNGDDTG